MGHKPFTVVGGTDMAPKTDNHPIMIDTPISTRAIKAAAEKAKHEQDMIGGDMHPMQAFDDGYELWCDRNGRAIGESSYRDYRQLYGKDVPQLPSVRTMVSYLNMRMSSAQSRGKESM